MNNKDAKIIRLIHHETGHLQSTTSFKYDNRTAAGIVNKTLKRHNKVTVDETVMFWGIDQVNMGGFDVEVCFSSVIASRIGEPLGFSLSTI